MLHYKVEPRDSNDFVVARWFSENAVLGDMDEGSVGRVLNTVFKN